MPQRVATKVKVNVTTITTVILSGIAMFALAGFGFMKTEIEPTIKTNQPGWAWSFSQPNIFSYDAFKINIDNGTVKVQEKQDSGTIQNIYPYSSGCYPHPAIGFLANYNGDVTFQISKDNLNWYYWNNGKWRNAENIDQANSASDINKHIIDFYPRSENQFFFKAKLTKQGSQLKSVGITCDQSTIKKIKLYPKSL